MKQELTYGLWAATLVVAGIIGWRATSHEAAATASPSDDGPPPAATGFAPAAPTAPAGASRPAWESGPIQPIPEFIPLDGRKVQLGGRLFHDTRLSSDGTVSCSSCHSLSGGGVDSLPVSIGVGGARGDLNAPTVLNCAFNFTQFWDGRARTLAEQMDGPIHNPKEMNTSWPQVSTKLLRDDAMVAEFQEVYGEDPSEATIRDAIVTFQRSLYTPNSRFDRWLKGEEDALTPRELEGYELFLDIGCATCHQGINMGGNSFQVFGKFHDYFAERGIRSEADYGRYNVTGRPEDRHKFKVPTLRNITLTSPYLHDGSIESLDEVVRVMAWYELGVELETDEVAAIVEFLGTLTAEVAPARR